MCIAVEKHARSLSPNPPGRQVYRHLLFNRLGRSDDTLDPSILRLGTLLILFDVYLTWARIEKPSAPANDSATENALSEAPIILQYLFFLTLNTLATLAQHATVRLLVRTMASRTAPAISVPSPVQPGSGSPNKEDLPQGLNHSPVLVAESTVHDTVGTTGPGRASPSAVSTALLVSSCTKLFPILLVIWPTQSPQETEGGLTRPSFASRARSYVGWAVLLNNIEALLILLDCGYVAATGLALAGSAARWLVEGTILGMVGLEGDAGPIGDLISFLGRTNG